MAVNPNMLNMLAEKVVQIAIEPRQLAYCPTMDLITSATVDGQVNVYRFNGQRVFGISSKSGMGDVKSIQWKPNGQILAVAFGNSILYLINAHTGKVVHQVDCTARSTSPICCLGWGNNSTAGHKTKQGKDKQGPGTSLEDLSKLGTNGASESPPDLPRDLAFLDVEALLPRLSSLALSGVEDDLFQSRTSIETVFQSPGKGSNDVADVLVVGFEDGTIHLSIYDFFEIGHFTLPTSSRFQQHKLLSHTYHPQSTTHPLLTTTISPSGSELHLLPLDLRLVSTAGRYLSLLASKSTQLHHVLRYIQQVQKQMYSEFSSSQELPRRFMRNVEETLAQSHDCTWVHAAYHLVVTGNCYPQAKEWLVDEISERGHKRWEKAVTTGYEAVRRLTHENLLPALERFTVLVSRLRGLSKFQDSNAGFGLSTQALDSVLDTSSCLQLLAHHVLNTAAFELRQFSAFSAWLHHEIEIQSADGDPGAAHDASERDNNIDHRSTLEYIQGAMNRSRLFDLFNIGEPVEPKSQWDLAAEGRSLYELYKRELGSLNKASVPEKELPGLDALIVHLDQQCNAVFTGIAETQKRNVRFGPRISLGVGNPRYTDMKMVHEVISEPGNFTLYVVTGFNDTADLSVFRMCLKIENGISAVTSVQHSSIQAVRTTIQDVKFIDDNNLMLAVKGDSSSHLLRVKFRKGESMSEGLTYYDYTGVDLQGHIKLSSVEEALILDPSDANGNEFVQHTFPADPSWAPISIEINGRKGRRAVCVLTEDRLRYRIFDLDSPLSINETLSKDGEEEDAMVP